MALFEYKCESCSDIKEILEKYEDNCDKSCDKCKGIMKRVDISRVSKPVFKGSGFYETDYKKKT